MPRALSWSVIAAAFVSGLYLPDFVAHAAVPPRKDASAVALTAAPDHDAPKAVPGLAAGGAVKAGDDGTVEVEEADKITPLAARDPSAMVMGPPLGGKACLEAPRCDCSVDSLHRYQPKAPRKKKARAPAR
ncbi:MAG: hypothetical protein SF051_03895 [Elusimicrobiota bacterium]|nr:hypothetical protein [Elusimicrobiota bacterium]